MRNKFKRHNEFYVYIVECANGAYYTGYTNNLEKRIREHNGQVRGAKYLIGKLPVKLVYAKEYRYFKRAVSKEREIKKLTHKGKGKLVRIYERSRKG